MASVSLPPWGESSASDERRDLTCHAVLGVKLAVLNSETRKLQHHFKSALDPGGRRLAAVIPSAIVMASLIGAGDGTGAISYPSMAPVEQYRMANRAEEIALARSAAPVAISKDADVLVLGEHGYETAVKGTNGFVCLVERSWFSFFGDSGFWNPRIRGPDCLNATAASSVLPVNLERTQWALAGQSKADMLVRSKSSATARQAPAPGSMGYMMSKQQYLSDADAHWHPHLMFIQPHAAVSAWGANLPGSPVMGAEGEQDEATILYIPVSKWSDGSPASMDMR